MDRKYKPLLPALRSPSGHSEPGELSLSATKRKRMYVKTACDICRVKKTACDGQRPACTPCTKRKSPCTFSGRPSGSDESRSPQAANLSNDADSASIIAALLTAHDSEAHELLDRLRQGRGTVEILEAWSEDDETAWKGPTILPPDQTSFEFELMIRHPVAYPALVPLDSRIEDNSTSEPLQTVNFEEVEHEQDVASDTELPDASDLGSAGYGTYEDRLKHIHFARWTKVAITGTEAAAAIANYLTHDHVLLQLFDAELFLKDVAHDYGEFCSSLLVNALLGWALPSIATPNNENENAAEAAYETALQQLEAQEEMPASLSAIAAIELLSLTALFKADGVRSHNLLRKALGMGQTMGLLVNRNDPSGQMSGLLISNEEEKSKALASWGLFSLTTIMSFHCQRSQLEPSLVPAYAFPEPNSDQPPSITETLPKCMSGLWILIHEVNSQLYRGEENVSEEAGIAFSSSMLARLLRWADELPAILARGNRSTQEVMILHVYLHAAIMTVTHPLVLRRDTATLLDGESSNRSAEPIFSASAMQMHRLVDSHQFHSRISTTTVLWHTALLFSSNASIRTSGNSFPARQWRLLRAMDAYADLCSRYGVMQTMFRGLMTMAVEAGLLGSQEAVKLARRLVEKGAKFEGARGKKVMESGFVADLELALVDRRMALADVLSQRFDEIVMFDDFTHEYRGS